MYIFETDLMEQHYTMADAIQDIKRTLKAKAEGFIESPERTVLDVKKQNASALYMPCCNLQSEMASVKIISVFPNNPAKGLATSQGIIILTDLKDGQHVATLEASYLTRLRTGALSAIATDRFAKKDANCLAVIGTGAMALEQVMGVSEVRTLEKIFLYNRSIEKAQKFKEILIAKGLQAEITICESADEATRQASIINCATRSNTSVIHKDAIKPNTHINAVGSYLPDMREVDTDLIIKENQIIVDDLVGVKHEAGEFIAAVESGQISWNNIYATLEDVVTNSELKKNSSITIFKSVGAAYFDLAVAEGVYKKLHSQSKEIIL